jgi:heat shock protein HtpX
MAHIKNRDVLIATVAAMLAAVVGAVGNALQVGLLFGNRSDPDDDNPAGGLLFALIAPIGATLVQLAISRAREYVADETASHLTRDPEALASALERLAALADVAPDAPAPATASLFIVNPLAGAPSWASWFSTHPPICQRIARLHALSLRLQHAA